MIRLEEVQHWHIDQIVPRAVYKNENLTGLSGLIGNNDVFSCAVVKDDLVLAIVGGTIMWEGMAHAWAIISDHVKKFPIEFHKQVKRLLESSIAELKLHRLEVTVKANFDMGRKWLESLGFEYEARLYQYGIDKSDYLLFARYA